MLSLTYTKEEWEDLQYSNAEKGSLKRGYKRLLGIQKRLAFARQDDERTRSKYKDWEFAPR